MRRAIATACVLAMMAGGVWAQTSGSAVPAVHTQKSETTKQAALRKKKEKAAAQELPAQTAPPVPATLMNSAPVKPTVTMERGLLTIDAPNSTLSDVLMGVQKATGAAMEGASPNERVALRLGPGRPEQVLAALLRGTPYDYVILGSLGRQDVVTRVLLTHASPSSGSPAPSSISSEAEPEPDASDTRGTNGFRPGISPHQPQMNNAPEAVEAQPNAESEQNQAEQPQQPAPPQQPTPPPQQQAQPQQDQLLKQLQQMGLAAPTPTQPKPTQ